MTDRVGSTPLGAEAARRIRRHGPLRFGELMDLALYDPVHGFYAAGGQAGRRGDFLTSPEVGPLFGAVVANYLDEVWRDLGEPDPFTVIEAGAGRGALAIAVRAATPACLPALTYVLVEQSVALRAQHPEHLEIVDPTLAFAPRSDDEGEDNAVRGDHRGTGPRFVSLGELPAGPLRGVVLANELLDNLPADLATWCDGAWAELRVALAAGDDGLVELATPYPPGTEPAVLASVTAPFEGARVPLAGAATRWLRDLLDRLVAGRVLLIDYGDETVSLARRPSTEWVRTYRAHERGGSPLEALGAQDITLEVPVDQLAAVAPPAHAWRQAEFLEAHGIDDLVEEGRRIWAERAPVGDLAALRARSRVREAEALLDPAGLGAFHVLEWRRPAR